MAVLVHSAHAHNCVELALGIEAYSRRHDLGWQVIRVRHGERWRIQDYLERHKQEPCAIVGMLHDPFIHKLEAWRQRLTVMSASAACTHPWAVKVLVDDHSIGCQAVDHLYRCGYRVMATWGSWSAPLHGARFAGVAARCQELDVPLHRVVLPDTIADEAEADAWILAQLAELPRPLGMITHQDKDAAFLRSVCVSNKVAVPAALGLVGVDNDVALCTEKRPELSSVQVPWQLLGQRMAQVWQQVVGQAIVPDAPILVPAYGVHARASTDLQSHQVGDDLVRRFLVKARKGAMRGHGVGELVKVLGISQPTLYRRVRAALGRKPQEIILDMRMAKACNLLRDTDLTLVEVAKRSGFSGPQHLHDAFVARYPVSPGVWRRG